MSAEAGLPLIYQCFTELLGPPCRKAAFWSCGLVVLCVTWLRTCSLFAQILAFGSEWEEKNEHPGKRESRLLSDIVPS